MSRSLEQERKRTYELRRKKVKSLSRVQLFVTPWIVGSSVHGIFQARIPEWAAVPFSRGSVRPRDRTQVSHPIGRLFTV